MSKIDSTYTGNDRAVYRCYIYNILLPMRYYCIIVTVLAVNVFEI